MTLTESRILINKSDNPEPDERFTHEIKISLGCICINRLEKLNSSENIILSFDDWQEIKKFIDNQINQY